MSAKKSPLAAMFLFVILIALPGATWYFMKTGLEYRTQAVEELINKIPFIASQLGPKIDLLNRTSVISFDNSSNDESIYNQFKKTNGFQLISHRMINTEEMLPNTYVKIDDSVAANLRNRYEGKAYLLLDNESNVRYTYDNSNDDMQLLIKHIAILLPLLPQRDTEEDEQ